MLIWAAAAFCTELSHVHNATFLAHFSPLVILREAATAEPTRASGSIAIVLVEKEVHELRRIGIFAVVDEAVVALELLSARVLSGLASAGSFAAVFASLQAPS